MPKFTVTLAQTVRTYGVMDIEADSLDDAIVRLHLDATCHFNHSVLWADADEPEMENGNEKTIVEILDDEGKPLIQDMPIHYDNDAYEILPPGALKARAADQLAQISEEE